MTYQTKEKEDPAAAAPERKPSVGGEGSSSSSPRPPNSKKKDASPGPSKTRNKGRNQRRPRSNSHPVERTTSNATTSSSNASSKNNNHANGNNRRRNRDRSNSHHGRERSNSFHHKHGPRKPQSKTDLWKGSMKKDIGNDVVVQMMGIDSKSANHTVYARVDPSCAATPDALAAVPVGKVIEVMVDEEWRHVARAILERGIHVEPDSYPSAAELLRLGAVWLLNETAYAAGDHAHARRLSPENETDAPEWKDMTLRVHVHPDRFHVAHEVDWGKYCRGLLLEGGTGTSVGGKRQRVPVTGMPDGKDGAIVYEDKETGFAVLNKPGGMPCHSTLSNHAEDVVSMFGETLKERSEDPDLKHPFLSLPLRVETEVSGLVLAATKKEFCSYMTKQIDESGPKQQSGASSAESTEAPGTLGLTKTHRCLVCIKEPDDIDRIEKLVGKTLEHFVEVRSATPKHFLRHRPKNGKPNDWSRCLMKITAVSSNSSNFRAACVSSKYSDSNDFTLAHRLWGPNMEHPAEDVGVLYVMQVDVQLLTKAPHQIRGQLAALGIPIVGDGPYGGGKCEMRMHRHMWHRMAVQICHLEFHLPRPESEEEGDGNEEEKKQEAAPAEEGEKVVCHLDTAWWSEYLVDYERHLVASTNA